MYLSDDLLWIIAELAEDLYWDFYGGVFQCIFCGATQISNHNPTCLVERAIRERSRLDDQKID